MKYPKKLEIRLTQEQYDGLQRLANELGTATATTARNLLTKAVEAQGDKSTNE